MNWLDRYIGTHSQREIACGKSVLIRVEKLGRKLRDETDLEIQNRARRLRKLATGGTPLDDLLLETFAVVREVSFRKIGLRHFDVQILGGVALHRGNIVEMKTGEGKTLAATLPIVLHALSGKGVHVITVNDYLAERDAQWMGPIFRFMGLTVGVVSENMDYNENFEARKAGYEADITYVTNHGLVFDYLRDNLAFSREEQVQRPLNFALVDEVDLLLLDEAGTPLIISGAAENSSDLSSMARQVVSPLKEGEHFRVDHKTRRVSVHDNGWTKMEKALKIDNLAAQEHIGWQHALHNGLLAHAVYQCDVDYIVQDGEIILIDDFTGRASPDRRFSDGLHQALEAKEGVAIQAEDQTLAKVSYQIFFRLYSSLCGMTGTAYSAREEFRRTYGLRVVVIPTNKPIIRNDEPSSVFASSIEKFAAVVEKVQETVSFGRPVLVGTTTVRESEHVSRLLSEQGIPHTVLNAKDDSIEAAAIAQAGRSSAVTVSTNMAGRGVDITLGGNTEGLDGEDSDAIRKQTEVDRARIVKKGGLMVIGTGLHESGRIDDQLRGRAGRQGDPGGSHYFLSLDDPIYRKFGEQGQGFQVLQKMRHRLTNHPHGEPLKDKSILRNLRELQKKVELENESIRREVLRYDLVVDQQRRTLYGWRQAILTQESNETVGLLREMTLDLTVDYEGHPLRLSDLESLIETEQLAALAGPIMLSTIDEMWTDHMGNLEGIDDAVGLRSYAQLDPLLEFKNEAHYLYQSMLSSIRTQTLVRLFSELPKS